MPRISVSPSPNISHYDYDFLSDCCRDLSSKSLFIITIRPMTVGSLVGFPTRNDWFRAQNILASLTFV